VARFLTPPELMLLSQTCRLFRDLVWFKLREMWEVQLNARFKMPKKTGRTASGDVRESGAGSPCPEMLEYIERVRVRSELRVAWDPDAVGGDEREVQSTVVRCCVSRRRAGLFRLRLRGEIGDKWSNSFGIVEEQWKHATQAFPVRFRCFSDVPQPRVSGRTVAQPSRPLSVPCAVLFAPLDPDRRRCLMPLDYTIDPGEIEAALELEVGSEGPSGVAPRWVRGVLRY
jgi:hypothetical protein